MALAITSLFFVVCGCIKRLVYGSNLKCSSWDKCKMKQKIYLLWFPLKHYQKENRQAKQISQRSKTQELLYPSCLNAKSPSFCTHMFATHNTNCLIFIVETLYMHWRHCTCTGDTVRALQHRIEILTTVLQ